MQGSPAKVEGEPHATADDLEIVAKVQQAARDGLAEESGWTKQQGRAGERAAMVLLEARGEQVTDLNRYRKTFALADIATDQRIQSVKVKGVGKKADEALFDNYRRDMEKLLAPGNANQAATELLQTGAPLPAALGKRPSHEQIARYIRQAGELAVPDDHVPGVRDNLERAARAVPDRYGLSASPAGLEHGIRTLRDRVQPIGVRSDYIDSIQREHRARG